MNKDKHLTIIILCKSLKNRKKKVSGSFKDSVRTVNILMLRSNCKVSLSLSLKILKILRNSTACIVHLFPLFGPWPQVMPP